MLTWRVDRFLRAGPLLALVTFVVPVLLAALVDQVSDVENVLGILLVASGIIFVGSLTGSIVAAGLGTLLFGFGAMLAEVSPVLLLIVSTALFANLMLHDLAGSLRRAPRINRGVWRNTLTVTAGIMATAAAAFGVAYFVATRSTWQSIVVPFGIAAIGFALKLAADSHFAETRQLTAKRVTEPAETRAGTVDPEVTPSGDA